MELTSEIVGKSLEQLKRTWKNNSIPQPTETALDHPPSDLEENEMAPRRKKHRGEVSWFFLQNSRHYWPFLFSFKNTILNHVDPPLHPAPLPSQHIPSQHIPSQRIPSVTSQVRTTGTYAEWFMAAVAGFPCPCLLWGHRTATAHMASLPHLPLRPLRSFLSPPGGGRTWPLGGPLSGQSCLFWHDFIIGWSLLVCGSQFGAFAFSIGLSKRYFSTFRHSTSVAYPNQINHSHGCTSFERRLVACVCVRVLVWQRH